MTASTLLKETGVLHFVVAFLCSRTELEETEKKLSNLRIDVENLESRLMEPQADKEMAEKAQPDVVLLDQHHTELQNLQREIERLEAKLPAGSKWNTSLL
jgi:predicted RNase H-like nuclease (RuvC/YqgF family)